MKRIKTVFALSIFLAILFWSGYITVALQKYNSHQARGDLTAYAQGLWNTKHGNPFASTFNYSVHEFWGNEGREITEKNSNIFGIHFNGILIFLLPIFVIFPFAETLILLQAGFVAISSIAICFIAYKLLKNAWLAILVQLSYLLHLSLITAVLSEFHAYPMSVLFSSLAIWAYIAKKRILYYISLILLLAVQENAGLPAIFFGFYLVLKKQTWKLGLLTIVLGISSLLLTTKILIPAFSPLNRFMFESSYGTPLGSSYIEMIVNSVKNPVLLFQTFINQNNIAYLFIFLLPVLPIALFAPLELFVGVFALTPNLISSASILKSLAMHYEAVAVPFIYFSLIQGAVFLKAKYSNPKTSIILALLIIVPLYSQYKLKTSLYFSPKCVWSCQLSDSRDVEIDKMLMHIPDNSSVSTQDYLSGHLFNRPKLYLFPVNYLEVDYLPLSKGDEAWPVELARHQLLLQELHASPQHSIIFESENYILFKKS